MSDDLNRKGDPMNPPIYAVELREQENGAELAMVRTLTGAESSTSSEDVWTNRYGDMASARAIMLVMMGRPDRWPVWAGMANILGTEFLTGLIEAEAAEAAQVAREGEQRALIAAERRQKAASEANPFRIALLAAGGPRLVASRNARSFLLMRFDTTVEALRVWDWVRWQTHSLPAWYHRAETGGAAALERFILQAMFAQERNVEAAGLSPGGRRPLRYWRPGTENGRKWWERPGPQEGEGGD